MIIAFAGQKGVGKSTLASFVEKRLKCLRYSLAQPLKQICSLYFGIPLKDFYDEKSKEEINQTIGYSPTQIMQIFGTNIVRNEEIDKFFPNMPKTQSRWIYLAEQFIKSHPNTNVIIDDVRFQDELDALKKLGAIVILVSRQTEFHDTHKSENQQLVNYDYKIENNSNIENIENKIIDILQWKDYTN